MWFERLAVVWVFRGFELVVSVVHGGCRSLRLLVLHILLVIVWRHVLHLAFCRRSVDISVMIVAIAIVLVHHRLRRRRKLSWLVVHMVGIAELTHLSRLTTI